MKKVLRVVISMSLVILAACSFIACDEGGDYKEAVAYEYCNQGTILEVSMVTDGTKVVYVRFDELFNLDLAGLANDVTLKAEEKFIVNIKQRDGTLEPTDFYKYIKLGDKLLVGAMKTIGAVDNAQEIAVYSSFSDQGAESVFNIEENEEDLKLYYESINSGAAMYQLLADDSTSTDLKFEDGKALTTSYSNIRKRSSTYWVGSSFKLGWHGNMDALEKYLVMNGVDNIDEKGNYVANDKKENVISGINTGATLGSGTGAYEYLRVAKSAYDLAIAK